MSSSEANEVGEEDLTQDILEQRIVSWFDYYTTQGGPHKGAMILRFLGFGVITLVGIDPEVARVRDIAVKVAHSGFHSRAEVWLRARNGADGWVSISQIRTQYYYVSYLA